jgi:hypothetical protein
MKKYIFILLAIQFSCREDYKPTAEEIKSENCATPARIKDLTGIDGCGYVFELNDGTRLNPICSNGEELKSSAKSQDIEYVDGKRVFIDYKVCDGFDACMVGPVVEIICIRAADPIPSCIQNKIEEIKKEYVRSPPAKIYRYTYHDKKVYFIPQHCCDFFSDLYDEDCNLICHPDGGFFGHGDDKCTDFFDARTDEELIWEDERE